MQHRIDGMPIKSPQKNKPHLSVIMSVNEDSSVETVVKALWPPHIEVPVGRKTIFHIPLDVIVDSSQLIRRTNDKNSQTNTNHLCLEKSKTAEWQANTRQPCHTYMNLFVPVTLEIPIDIGSFARNAESPMEKNFNMIRSQYASRSQSISMSSFDGSEKSFARLRDDYYRSQMARGDPIRSKRTKRAQQE